MMLKKNVQKKKKMYNAELQEFRKNVKQQFTLTWTLIF